MNCSTHAQPQQSRGIFFEARQFITARYKHGNEERKARRDLLCVLPVQGVATSSEDESVESLNQPPEKSVDTSSLESIVRSAPERDASFDFTSRLLSSQLITDLKTGFFFSHFLFIYFSLFLFL